jgi:hypothetical protein
MQQLLDATAAAPGPRPLSDVAQEPVVTPQAVSERVSTKSAGNPFGKPSGVQPGNSFGREPSVGAGNPFGKPSSVGQVQPQQQPPAKPIATFAEAAPVPLQPYKPTFDGIPDLTHITLDRASGPSGRRRPKKLLSKVYQSIMDTLSPDSGSFAQSQVDPSLARMSSSMSFSEASWHGRPAASSVSGDASHQTRPPKATNPFSTSSGYVATSSSGYVQTSSPAPARAPVPAPAPSAPAPAPAPAHAPAATGPFSPAAIAAMKPSQLTEILRT